MNDKIDFIRTDCKNLIDATPCPYSDVWCGECLHYVSVLDKTKILIVIRNALGDVLMSTPILRALKRKYPGSYIYWLIDERCRDILIYNEYIDKIIIFNWRNIIALQSLKFDLIINYDNDNAVAAIISKMNSDHFVGINVDSNGIMIPYNETSKNLVYWKLSRKFRRNNRKSLIELYFESLTLEFQKDEYILTIPKKYKIIAEEYINSNINDKRKIIGIHPGSRNSRSKKRWHLEKYIQLISKLQDKYYVLIFIGPDEVDYKNEIDSKIKNRYVLYPEKDN